MKKLSTFVLALFVTASAAAQVKLDVVLNPAPPANLSEWGARREVLTVIVAPGPGLALQFKIKVEIIAADGTTAGTNDLSRAQIFTMQSTPQILTAMEVMPIENMIFTGKYKSSLQRTGKLPSGNYTLCLTPVRPQDLTPMAQPVCKPFFLATTQLPILMKPYDEQVLDGKSAQTAITFRWTPVTPRTPNLVTYRIQVFEVLEHQSPVQALRANQPLLDQEVFGTTQFIWRPQLSFIKAADITTSNPDTYPAKDKAKKEKDSKTKDMLRFVWTIQSLDSHGDPVTRTDGNGEARSEPIMFFVDPVKNNPPKKVN